MINRLHKKNYMVVSAKMPHTTFSLFAVETNTHSEKWCQSHITVIPISFIGGKSPTVNKLRIHDFCCLFLRKFDLGLIIEFVFTGTVFVE